MARHTAVAVLIGLLLAGRCAAQSAFDLAQLAEVQGPSIRSAGDRVAIGVEYLREEVAHPSAVRWGVGGGPIDTGYVLQQITRALAFPGAHSPQTLRDYRAHEPEGLVFDCLTIALGATGAQDTATDLMRIASKCRYGALRGEAITVLAHIGLPPRPGDSPSRVRSGEVWKPLDAKTDASVEAALFAALDDPYTAYRGATKDENAAWYPNQNAAAVGLRLRGYTVRLAVAGAKVTGWRVFDKGGALVRSTRLATPRALQREDAGRY